MAEKAAFARRSIGHANTASLVFLLLCLSPVDGRVKGLFSKYTKAAVDGSSSPQQAAAKNQDVEALLNGGSLLDAPCISVPEDRLEEAMSPDGNGRDAQLEA
ncbi:Uncharacterized protein SCF082_LOCUS8264 [Durusdinium trenchii]|uniref:Uncharacterized protein n=1 Tax=Durusdinium trenchii TaxID=1381693 RepID=A0ABP0IPX2_9DINO